MIPFFAIPHPIWLSHFMRHVVYAIEIIFRLILFAGGSIINSSNSFLLVPSAFHIADIVHALFLRERPYEWPSARWWYITTELCRVIAGFAPSSSRFSRSQPCKGIVYCLLRYAYLIYVEKFLIFLSLSKLFKREQPSIASLCNSITSQLKTYVSLKRKCKSHFKLVQW